MQRIEINNFGPIKELKLDIKVTRKNNPYY